MKKKIRRILRRLCGFIPGLNKKIVVYVDGGICSQINQYVVGKLFEDKGYNVVYDLAFYDEWGMDVDGRFVRNFDLLKLFPDIEVIKATKIQRMVWKKCFRERNVDLEAMQTNKKTIAPCYVTGYYSLPNEDYRRLKSLLGEMSFDSKYKEIIENEMFSCGVHVRRGDLSKGNGYYGNPATIKYYVNSIRLIASEYPNTKFFIFSDEMDYVYKELLPNLQNVDCVCVEGNGSDKGYVDLALLSLCNFQISSIGSFGKFAALLNANDTQGLVLMNTPESIVWVDRYRAKKWIVDL